MKNIQDILKRKISRGDAEDKRELDEKTIARIFLETAKEEIKNLEEVDIREIKRKERILYVKTAHPVVSSELFLRKETILKKICEIAGETAVDKIVIN